MPKTSITGSLISVDLDKTSKQPIHRQIADQLREAILQRRLGAGIRLPSTRVFADELGVSRNTVLQVFDVLRHEGFLASRLGAGTFVAERASYAQEYGTAVKAAPASIAFPFRSLSRRGKSVVASATADVMGRPSAFMPDVPDRRAFPIRTWLRLLSETSGRLTGDMLADPTNAGYEPLRRAIAQYLNASRQMNCDYRQVIVTTGSQQSLDLICRMLLDPGDTVWLEEPCFGGTRAVVAANGAVILPIPIDGDGMRVEETIATKPAPRMILVTPSRHYPLGATLSLDRRRLLIEFARSCGAWIVEDDYEQEFRYAGLSLPSIQGLDADRRTIQIGTFSKTLLPSFRLGYVVVPIDFEVAFAKVRAVVDRHVSLIEQMVLSEFIIRGLFVAHVRKMRSLYRTRQTQLLSGLRTLVDGNPCIGSLDTGTNLAVAFKPGIDDRRIVRLAMDQGITLRALSDFYVGGDRKPGLLIGFSAFDQSEIAEGLQRLEPLRAELAASIKDATLGR